LDQRCAVTLSLASVLKSHIDISSSPDTVERESGAKCHLHDHNYGFNPNIICEFKGTENPEELVILGAHYDSRGTFGYVRAPGGDDDASGVSALMSLARIFKAYNIQFKRTVVLAFFSGEEQGLWGSRGYAKHLKDLQEEQKHEEDGLKVRFMLQADMLGYHAPGEPMQLALPDKYDTIEAVSAIQLLLTLTTC
jgi:Zn-dependent M28 family amino/carboxypeptidase